MKYHFQLHLSLGFVSDHESMIKIFNPRTRDDLLAGQRFKLT
jgi:hypothetical protein